MHGLTVRTATALIGPVVRAMRWRAFGSAAAAGLLIVGVPAALGVVLLPENLAGLLRVAAVCLAVGVAFLLDDPAAPSTTTVPTTRRLRQALRIGLAVPAVAVCWAAAAGITVAGAAPGVAGQLPLAGLTLEAAALCAVALCVAALVVRRSSDGIAGTAAAPGLLILAVVGHLLPAPAALFVAPGDPRWTAAHHRWGLLLVTATLIAVWAGGEPRPGVAPGRPDERRPEAA